MLKYFSQIFLLPLFSPGRDSACNSEMPQMTTKLKERKNIFHTSVHLKPTLEQLQLLQKLEI